MICSSAARYVMTMCHLQEKHLCGEAVKIVDTLHHRTVVCLTAHSHTRVCSLAHTQLTSPCITSVELLVCVGAGGAHFGAFIRCGGEACDDNHWPQTFQKTLILFLIKIHRQESNTSDSTTRNGTQERTSG